jgi:hypothetical protein
MEPQNTNRKKVGIGVAVVALLGLIAVVIGANKPSDSASTTTTPDTTSTTPTDSQPAPTTPAVAPSPTPTPTNKSTSAYKDGTYSATGSYESPGGLDHLGVTLTIKNDIVTDATVKAEPGDRESAYYQNIFISNCRPLVVGKDISTLSLSKVSGSSLTSGGFNDAVAQIKAQAKA